MKMENFQDKERDQSNKNTGNGLVPGFGASVLSVLGVASLLRVTRGKARTIRPVSPVLLRSLLSISLCPFAPEYSGGVWLSTSANAPSGGYCS